MRTGLLRLLNIAILSSTVLSAQAQMQIPKPAPELKRLDYFAGTWKMDGDMKPGPMGPGGKMSLTQENHWMEGGFFLLVRSKFSSAAMGNGSGISLMGYDPDAKAYTYDEYNSMGEAVHSKGTFSVDTWTWTSDETMGDKTMKGRFTMKLLSTTSYDFKFDVSQDGSTWTTVMDGKATKVK